MVGKIGVSVSTVKCSVRLNFTRKTVPSSRTLPRETESFSGVGDSCTAEIQLVQKVFCLLCFIWEGTTFFGGGGGGLGVSVLKALFKLTQSDPTQYCWDPFEHLFGQCFRFLFQIRVDRVQTFYSVLSNMFPCATDHHVGTYYPHLKKKRRFEA